MARVTAEDREREVTIEWTETIHKTLTLPFADMAKLLKIKQGELKDALDEGEGLTGTLRFTKRNGNFLRLAAS
jgi:hypothetical protein